MTRCTRFLLSTALLICFCAFFSHAGSAATPEEFYRNALEYDNIHAFAATCQSAHETGYWTSHLWKNAKNGAGIKADKNWLRAGKPAVKKNSREVVGGQTKYRVSYFRAYGSLDDFLSDYRLKITRDYPLAAKNSDTMWGYFSSLQKGRMGSWATTQKYFEHMTNMAVKLAPRLLGVEWRAQLLAEYNEARARGLLSQNEIAIIEKKFKAAGIPLRK